MARNTIITLLLVIVSLVLAIALFIAGAVWRGRVTSGSSNGSPQSTTGSKSIDNLHRVVSVVAMEVGAVPVTAARSSRCAPPTTAAGNTCSASREVAAGHEEGAPSPHLDAGPMPPLSP